MDMNGYGNRLYSLLTSFVAAVLTDSALMVSRWNGIRDYIDEPMNRTFHKFSRIDPFNPAFKYNYIY